MFSVSIFVTRGSKAKALAVIPLIPHPCLSQEVQGRHLGNRSTHSGGAMGSCQSHQHHGWCLRRKSTEISEPLLHVVTAANLPHNPSDLRLSRSSPARLHLLPAHAVQLLPELLCSVFAQVNREVEERLLFGERKVCICKCQRCFVLQLASPRENARNSFASGGRRSTISSSPRQA